MSWTCEICGRKNVGAFAVDFCNRCGSPKPLAVTEVTVPMFQDQFFDDLDPSDPFFDQGASMCDDKLITFVKWGNL